MEKVEWESGGTKFRAVKLEGLSNRPELDNAVASLVEDGLRPTLIIGGQQEIRAIRERFAHRIISECLGFFYDGVDLVPFTVDHRIKDAAYILYEDMDLSELEAPEFAGLEELP